MDTWLRHTDRVASRHQRRARRDADGLCVEAGEFEAFGCHFIEMRSFDFFRSKATEVAIALIVCENDADVGFGLEKRGGGDGAECEEDGGRGSLHTKGLRLF